MKYLFTLCLLIVSLSGISQWQQTGARVRYVNGLGIPTRDTAAGVAADSSQILIRPADSSLYIKYKRTWVKVGAGGTIGGSGTINRVSKFTGATTVGNSSIVDSASAVAMTINPSGDVGIGTTSPAHKLDVQSSGLNIVRIKGGTGTGQGSAFYQTFAGSGNTMSAFGDRGTMFGTTVDQIASIYTQTSIPLSFDVGATERMRITSAGDVGINQTAPAGRFVVADGQTLLGTNTNNGVDRLQVSGNVLGTLLKFNTSGQSSTISNKYQAGTSGFNIFIGNGGGSISGTSGDQSSYNVSLGHGALASLTTGLYNFGIGAGALGATTTGYENVAIGKDALALNTSGYNNTAIGTPSMVFNTTGYKNSAIGYNSFLGNLTGYSNIAIGVLAGTYISGGSNNQTANQSIYIGEDTRASAAGNTNEMVFGHNTIGQGSNTVILGNSSITKTFLRGTTLINTTTDNGIDKLIVNGSIDAKGFAQVYTAKSATYTATTSDYLIDCTTGTFTVNLPDALLNVGRILIIKNSGTGTITVDGNGSQTIDGATTYSLSAQYATVQLMCDGNNWKIISKF